MEKVEKGFQKQLFPRFGPPKRLEVVEKVGFDNFFHHFYDSKDLLKNSLRKWKKLSKPTFSTTQAVLEAQIVEKVVFDNFFHHFYDSKDFLNNSWKKVEKVEKVVKTNFFHDSSRFGGPNLGKSCF